MSTVQSTITENPFASAAGREESPISIGESLTTVPEEGAALGHQRNTSNPFAPEAAWDLEKQHFVSEMALLREQLKSETTARLESQVSNGIASLSNTDTYVHVYTHEWACCDAFLPS